MKYEKEFKWAAESKKDFRVFLSALKKHAAVSPAQKQNIKDIYFDGPGGYYSKNKIACRLRESGGRFTLTLKGASEIVSGLAVREEKNIRLKSASRAAALKEILKYLPEKNIKKVFGINNKRTVYEIKKPVGAEICFDDFFITARGRKMRMFEIEMELKKGKENIFKNFAAVFARESGLEFSSASKIKTAFAFLKSTSEKRA